MFARLTFIKVLPEHTDRVRTIYSEEIIPVLRQQKGLVDMMLLEPTDKADDFISLTRWERQADAEAYEASGVYRQLVGKVMDLAVKQPVLKTYSFDMVGQGIAAK